MQKKKKKKSQQDPYDESWPILDRFHHVWKSSSKFELNANMSFINCTLYKYITWQYDQYTQESALLRVYMKGRSDYENDDQGEPLHLSVQTFITMSNTPLQPKQAHARRNEREHAYMQTMIRVYFRMTRCYPTVYAPKGKSKHKYPVPVYTLFSNTGLMCWWRLVFATLQRLVCVRTNTTWTVYSDTRPRRVWPSIILRQNTIVATTVITQHTILWWQWMTPPILMVSRLFLPDSFPA